MRTRGNTLISLRFTTRLAALSLVGEALSFALEDHIGDG